MRLRPACLLLIVACTRAPAQHGPPAQPVPSDRSDPPGHKGQPTARPSHTAPADQTRTSAEPPPVALTPVVLAADAGLRVVAELRGWDFAAAPGRIVALSDDFRQLEAFDPATGASLWRTQVQDKPGGRHTLHLQGEQVILHAGSTRIHVELKAGRRIASVPAVYNGNDSGCAMRVYEGADLATWGVWTAPSTTGSACAESCSCDLRLFDCTTGAAIGEPFQASETHLYHSLDAPHDTVCWNQPAVLVRASAALLVRADDERHEPTIFGLAPDTGKRLWQRRDLGASISHFNGIAGTDPTGQLCWLGDGDEVLVLDCSKGTTRWRARLGDPEGAGQTFVTWQADALVLTHRDPTGTRVELRDARGGKRRWRRSLPADRMPLLRGTALPAYVSGELRAFVLLDPATGATRGEIDVEKGQELRGAPEGGYLRVGLGRLAELDAQGKLLRERPLTGQLLGGTRTHLVERTADAVRVLRRDTLAPVLTLTGTWSLSPAQAALGAQTLLLIEHRGQRDMGRALLLAPSP